MVTWGACIVCGRKIEARPVDLLGDDGGPFHTVCATPDLRPEPYLSAPDGDVRPTDYYDAPGPFEDVEER